MDEQKIVQMLRRHRDGESITSLCREYGIARKTFYAYQAKLERFLHSGNLRDLGDQRSQPKRPDYFVEVAAALAAYAIWQPRKGARAILKDLQEANPGHPIVSELSATTLHRYLAEMGLSTYEERRQESTVYQKATRVFEKVTTDATDAASRDETFDVFAVDKDPTERRALELFVSTWATAALSGELGPTTGKNSMEYTLAHPEDTSIIDEMLDSIGFPRESITFATEPEIIPIYSTDDMLRAMGLIGPPPKLPPKPNAT